MISAFNYLKNHNIVHRDIKPENIVCHNKIYKLTDFGCATIIKNKQKRNTFCGTLHYLSPEMI